MEKREIHIDLETYSDVDLISCGVYTYAHSPAFEILLLGFAFNEDPVQQIDIAMGEEIPQKVIDAILDESYTKVIHNSTFERICLSEWLKAERLVKVKEPEFINGYLNPKNWKCTAVHAAELGMPRSLDAVGKALHLEEKDTKLSTGKSLINYFCKPCKPTKANGYRKRNLPVHEPEKWELLKVYNLQDVTAERAIGNAENKIQSLDRNEQALYELDQLINDEGVAVDMTLIDNILEYVYQHTEKLTKEMIELTGLENPMSVSKLKEYISDKTDSEAIESLNKADVESMITTIEDKDVVRALEIRQQLGKTSVAKFDAMKRAAIWHEESQTWRVHGMLMFYGAMRTGRWAGRIVQLQNLPQNKIADLDDARKLVLAKDWETLDLCYESPMDIFSQLIRTAFIPDKDHTFLVADYNAIEARVISWFAGEKWKLDVFNKGGKIYEETASRMFKIPVESITHESTERAKGKIAELAGGYGGGKEAYKKMGAEKYGWTDAEIDKMVYDWRASNTEIVALWKEANTAMINAIKQPGHLVPFSKIDLVAKPKFFLGNNTLFMSLPSQRALSYREPKLEIDAKFGTPSPMYLGENNISGHYEMIRTYGGRIVENLVQATARDCLAYAMMELKKAGYHIRFHVHDEVVLDIPNEKDQNKTTEEVKEIMALKTTKWLEGLPLKAESYYCHYYLKQ